MGLGIGLRVYILVGFTAAETVIIHRFPVILQDLQTLRLDFIGI